MIGEILGNITHLAFVVIFVAMVVKAIQLNEKIKDDPD